MHYTSGELKDLLVYALCEYQTAKSGNTSKEDEEFICGFIAEKGDKIIEEHNDYLQYLSLEADKAHYYNEWHHGDNGY